MITFGYGRLVRSLSRIKNVRHFIVQLGRTFKFGLNELAAQNVLIIGPSAKITLIPLVETSAKTIFRLRSNSC